jgi:hypothetical protein
VPSRQSFCFQATVCMCFSRPWRTTSKFMIMVARESFCPCMFFVKKCPFKAVLCMQFINHV